MELLFNQPLNLIGFLADPRGIGQVAQGIRDSLRELKVPFVESDIADLASGLAFDARTSHYEGRLNISVVNPGETRWVYEKFGKTSYRGCYNIGHWSWELNNSVPQDWKQHIGLFDELWAPSTFIRNTFIEHFKVPTYTLSPIVRHRTDQTFKRADFGLGNDEYVFLFLCDFKSIAERKNPLALVRAFKEAFTTENNVRLVLKLSSGATDPEYLQRLQSECANARILLIDEIMPRQKIDSLFGLCDSYVSLHRCEGFGITLAEAMLAGKPVIATGWSGNLDFMTDDNSYLVKHKLIELDRNYGPYMAGEHWAEPDLEHAAQLMKEVFDKRFQPNPRTKSAVASIEQKYSLGALSQSISQRLQAAAPFVRMLERVVSERETLPCTAKAGGELTDHTIPPLMPREGGCDREASAAESAVNKCAITVCLPVFNGAAYLEKAIDSVLKQSFQNFELLIADDQSTDDSLQIIEGLAKTDQRIRYWTNHERIGLFKNYNLCIHRANGAFIKLFAQDDVLEPDALFTQMEILQAHPSVSLVCCDKTFINELGNPFVPEDSEQLARLEEQVAKDIPVCGADVIAACFFPVANLIGEPSTVMFRKESMGEGFDESFYHVGDLDYWFQLLVNGDYFRTSKPLCQFRRHSNSATARNVQSLLYAVDTLKLGKKFLSTLLYNGFTYEEFLNDAIYCLAAQSLRLTDRDLFAGAEEIVAALPTVDPRDFRELAFRALQYAGRCNLTAQMALTASAYSKQADPISILEREVRSLLDSPYWHVTKPLRDTKRAVARGFGNNSQDLHFQSGLDNDDYLEHLEKLRDAILQSRSWKITKPLRSMFLQNQSPQI